MSASASTRQAEDLGFEIHRRLAAPLDLVYRVWTDPAYVAAWWGVQGSTIVRCDLDVRVGGRWRIDMRSRSGTVYPNSGTYLDVRPLARLVYDDVPHPDSPAWTGDPPGTRLHTIAFEADGPDVVVIHRVDHSSRHDLDRLLAAGVRAGLEQELDRLAALIARLSARP